MQKVLRCAAYIRVSTAEQQIHGKSLPAQKEALERYAAEHDMKVVGVYADEGKTARKELKKRKAIFQLLEAVKRDEIDVILFWRMDRWFRNVSDFYKVQDILDAHNVKWISISEPTINTETRDGRLQLNLVLTIGQNEVDTTSERIRFTNQSMIRSGKLIFGKANMPPGYKIGYINGEKKMVKDEKTEEMVNDFFRYYLLHQAKRQTVIYIQEHYDYPFTYSTLRGMLQSEFYIGKYRDNTNYCPAYLTQAQWDKIQELQKRNVRKPRTDRVYIFTGIIHCPICGYILCGCGCPQRINRKTGEKKVYNYYRCNGALLQIGSTHNKSFQVSELVIERYLLEHLEEEYKKYQLKCEKIQEKKQHQIMPDPKKIERKIERVNRLYLDDRISEEQYETEYQQLQKELEDAMKIEIPPEKDYSQIETLLSMDFVSLYNRLDRTNKQAFWRSIIQSIELNPDKTVKSVEFF